MRLALAVAPNEACYIPLAHRKGGDGDGLFGGGLHPEQISEKAALAALKPLLEERGVLKIGLNLKYELQVFAVRGIEMQSHEDIMLMSYVLDAGRFGHSLDALGPRYFNHAVVDYNDVIGSGKAKVTFDHVTFEKAAPYVAEDADIALRLSEVLKARMVAEHVMSVYETLERPLLPVLARMERRGISIDRQVLSRLSGEFAQRGAALEAEVRTLAGDPSFNPGSPKQLGDILFGKMQLPGGTKTKTGQWSTGARVLDELAEQGLELPQKILEWRQVTKLKSTYTDALPGYINPATNRVHTNYALAATPTGRLSSSEPNLQNIPIRNDEGRKIRRAFVATPGNKLVSADYSQIELRLLAEIADVPALRQAFKDGLDIHAMTASEMFGVPVKDMPADVRRRAKAINFGIIYGISAFGLANQLAIPREEAGAYIKKYFERFPGIRAYMDDTKAFAKKNGYVLTLFGRKCHYPDIANSNPSVRAFNERAAINARLQGSAADIIRRAMIRMDEALAAREAQRADAAAGARRTGVRGAGERSREDPAGGQDGDGGRAACPPSHSRCRSRSTRTLRATGTRRIKVLGPHPVATELGLARVQQSKECASHKHATCAATTLPRSPSKTGVNALMVARDRRSSLLSRRFSPHARSSLPVFGRGIADE